MEAARYFAFSNQSAQMVTAEQPGKKNDINGINLTYAQEPEIDDERNTLKK